MDDLINRQAAIDALIEWYGCEPSDIGAFENIVEKLPSAQPTLYGYKIEILAYIARVMEKEGITAEQAVNAFDDLGMAVRLITEEALQKFEEAVIDG